jgi:hypothetical protein
MELFNEVKNRYFQLVFRIINECADGKAKSDILKLIDEGEFEQKVIGKNQQSFADMILNRTSTDENLNLLTEKEGMFYPCIENTGSSPVPVRFTKIEKAWLKALLEQDGVRKILSKQTMEKLKAELVDFDTPIKDEYFEMTNITILPEITLKEAYDENFKIILEALLLDKPIRYNNIDKKGFVSKNKLALPIGIEYSMRDERFRVSMYSLDDNRPIMANIFSLLDIRIVDEEVNIDRETAKKLMFEQKYSSEPVVIEVTDRKAAMERCFMCFSGMERTSRELGNNKYEIQLNYYLFEEENLIRNIISLGPYVKVVSPTRIADEIVGRVKKAISQYNEKNG